MGQHQKHRSSGKRGRKKDNEKGKMFSADSEQSEKEGLGQTKKKKKGKIGVKEYQTKACRCSGEPGLENWWPQQGNGE